MYITLANKWKEIGGGMFCHYTFCQSLNKFNTFGSLERIDQDIKTAPKYRALLDVINS